MTLRSARLDAVFTHPPMLAWTQQLPGLALSVNWVSDRLVVWRWIASAARPLTR